MIILVLLVLIITLIYLIIKLIKILNNNKIKNTQKLQFQKNEVKNEILTPNNNDIFIQKNIRSTSYQILESLDIISNTKSIDTLCGRYDFILKIYDFLIENINHSTSIQNIQNAIDEFKTNYYDRVITEEYINLIIKPNHDALKLYISKSIFECFKNFEDNQSKEIQNLKMKSAIGKRIEHIIKIGYTAKYLFKTYDLPDKGYLEKIELIRSKYYFKK